MTAGVKFNVAELEKVLKNSVQYSRGFLEGAELNMIVFNKKLSDIAAEALKRYIDSRARMSPESLHHVYEWGRVGDPSARLFEIDCQATKNTISIFGKFLPSSSISENSEEPFVDKARVMENKIAIEIEPRSTNVLAFDVDGQTVFTVNSVFIANPGGDAVAGSFGRVVDEFFDVYFNTTLLRQSGIFDNLKYPKEFSQYFGSVASGNARGAGLNAGRKYMDIEGVTVT